LYLAVTIDTEEDNWGEYQRSTYSIENIARIPRLQQLFDDHAVRPTYLISYPVACNSVAIDILGRYREDNVCEIGTHPHPWNTPPVDEQQTVFNSYMGNLPANLQYRKIRMLHDTIERNFGVTPTSYRSGKWGFSDDVARNLIRLGYSVDSSISPSWDWSRSGGPDYSRCSHEPFVYQIEGSSREPGGTLLEVPATIDFVQTRRAVANAVYWSLTRRGVLGERIAGVLNRLGVLNHICISPETHNAPQMIRLAKKLLGRGTRVINMFFHSPTLLPSCTPFVRSEADVDDFLGRIRGFLTFAKSAGLRAVTMSELHADNIGARRVRLLDSTAGS
jgi:hypothetical protein